MQAKTIIVHEPQLTDNRLICTYTADGEDFTNSFEFPAAVIADPNNLLTHRLVRWVGIITAMGLFSVEYFDRVACEFGLNRAEIEFFEKIFFLGLGEFRYVNGIDLNRKTSVVGTGEPLVVTQRPQSGDKGPLLLNGGGKDGSVSAYLLTRAGIDFTWFQRDDKVMQARVVEAWGIPAVITLLHLDPTRRGRKYTGHRPTSASIALIAILFAHLFGYSHVITSNEASANEGNLTQDGFTVNHQYSKSLEFEKDLQHLLNVHNAQVGYFSLLRSLHELQIAMIAAKLSDTQLAAITSCNNSTRAVKWCMACPKCAFVALVITAASPEAAQKMWGTRSAVCTEALRPHLVALLDPAADKPLECVGTLAECQLAAHLICGRFADVLDPTTRDLFQKYAAMRDASQDDSILSSRSPDAVPEQFRGVIPVGSL